MALTLTLNGQIRTFKDLSPGTSLADFVASLELQGDRIALELNGSIAPRTAWSGTHLTAGDRLEMVHFVGGGSLG